jgi:D-alanyl-D-alanine carboxypeptidase/D-alanyl-D-alanine-endopeptidase (penicillin-binding protein 4)
MSALLSRVAALSALVCGATVLAASAPAAAPVGAPLPPEVLAALRRTGVPLSHMGVYVRAVDGAATPAPLAALNEDQPFLLASTAKVVTSLAALKLLGSRSSWRSQAYATGPVSGGRLAGDLVIVGGDGGLTPGDLRRWFQQMQREGLKEVSGRIVLERVALLQDLPLPGVDDADGGRDDEAVPQRAVVTLTPAPGGAPVGGQVAVQVAPGAGGRVNVSLRPLPPGVQVVNDVASGGGCAVYARWTVPPGRGGAAVATVSGRWDRSCGRRDAALLPWTGAPLAAQAAARAGAVEPRRAVAAPPSAPAVVATLWQEAGGRVRGGVVQRAAAAQPARGAQARAAVAQAAPATQASRAAWHSALATSLPERLREMNKASLNSAAQQLMLSLAEREGRGTPLERARLRMKAWLHDQGLRDDDIAIDLGSGQSRNERGRPRALVQLLLNAWAGEGVSHLIASLPVAGVDGTLAHRMQKGPARGQAYLKTGTLRDTRALAGYVTALSGRTYAVAALVNDPQAARATPALDAVIEWVVRNG